MRHWGPGGTSIGDFSNSMDLILSGERFLVVYRLRGDEVTARATAAEIGVEQTIEFPLGLAPPGGIRNHIVGQVTELRRDGPDHWLATLSYAVESSGFELTQLLNVIFGNFSLKPNVRVEHLELPVGLLAHFRGPRFGRDGWRGATGVPGRPLLATALKPMGLPPTALADLAYRLALGGIDLIKDDHGLADQPFAPFSERVARCVAAVDRANRETGERCLYLPNVTAPGDQAGRLARAARQAGAGGLLISPGLTGLGVMQHIADDEAVDLPLMAHPAFQGSFVVHPDHGIAHGVVFGQIARLAGADASIFPNFGGRFSFSRDECLSIATACAAPLGELRPILPAPGGGMSLERVPDMLDVYGRDVIFLIGGGLHQRGPDLQANGRYFRSRIES